MLSMLSTALMYVNVPSQFGNRPVCEEGAVTRHGEDLRRKLTFEECDDGVFKWVETRKQGVLIHFIFKNREQAVQEIQKWFPTGISHD